MSISGFQAGAARCLLGNIPVEEVVSWLEISSQTYYKFERENGGIGTKKKEKLRLFFENRGAEFTGDKGVVVQDNPTKTLKGQDGFRLFMDDVFETGRATGGQFCIYNGVPDMIIRWAGADWYEMHKARMIDIRTNMDFKVIVEEGTANLIGNDFVHYRYWPSAKFLPETIYIYGNRVAFITFSETDVEVMINFNQRVADSMRFLFSSAWNEALT